MLDSYITQKGSIGGNLSTKMNRMVASLRLQVFKKRDSLCKEFQLLTIKDEIFCKQRARIRWLKEGDRNTKFFHQSVSIHRNINGIHGIMADGVWINDQVLIRREVEAFYSNLYKENHQVRPLLDGMELDCISSQKKTFL